MFLVDLDDTLIGNGGKATEEYFPSLFEEIKRRGALVFAFTARKKESHEKTKIELNNIGISFDSYGLDNEPYKQNGGFYDGIFYLGGGILKGEMIPFIMEKLKTIEIQSLIFADDMPQIIDSVQKALLSFPLIQSRCFVYYNKKYMNYLENLVWELNLNK